MDKEKKSKTFSKITHRKKRAFLTAYARVGNISEAAEIAKIDRGSHYHWMDTDPDYPVWFETAKEEAADRLEAEARRRAVEGVVEPVFHQGKMVVDENGQPVGIRRFSDTLLIFLMKGVMPEKYAERTKQDVKTTYPNGLDIVHHQASELTPEQRQARIEELLRKREQ